MKILSIHFAHDSNISYLNKGKILENVNEERFSRNKMHVGWPSDSLKWLFKKYNLSYDNFDKIVIINDINKKNFEEPFNSIEGYYKLLKITKPNYIGIISKIINLLDYLFPFFKIKYFILKKLFLNFLIKNKINLNKVEFVDHHLAHAAGSFFMSNFSESLIFTMDGKGDGVSHKTYIGSYDNITNKCNFKLVSESKDYDSLGFFYSCITEYLGFKRIRHEGKITGLAAYGDYNKVKNILFPYSVDKLNNNIKFKYIDSIDRFFPYILYLKFLFLSPKVFFNVLFNYSCIYGRYNQEKNLNIFKTLFKDIKREHVSAYAQNNLEKIVLKLINNTFLQKLNNKKYNICLSGGIFANVKLNQRIKELEKVNDFFVIPGMGDGGLAIGGALLINNKINQNNIIEKTKDVFSGPEYSDEEIKNEILKFKFKFEYLNENLESRIANLLHSNKIVGRFHGRMEWGPRALGNRSILANPTKSEINDFLNERLNRTEFMPFAPSIMKDHANQYLIGYQDKDIAANFMTVTYDIYDEKIKEIPAVVHIDKTARPQIVDKENNIFYYNIINEYYKLSGIPVIINTSFNLHEEPIVCSPYDALRALNQNAIDYLIIGNYLVEK